MARAVISQNNRSRRLLLLLAFCTPGLALLAGTALQATSPSIAAASDAQTDAPPVAVVRLPPRVTPQEVTERIDWLRELPGVPNPLYYPPKVEPVVAPPPKRAEPKPVDLSPSAPAPFVVTAMLRGRDGSARAVIDGALFDAGDEVAPGWVIIEINPTKRHVSLRKPDGTTLLLPLHDAIR